MKTLRSNRRSWLWLAGFAVFAAISAFWLLRGWETEAIDSFKSCTDAGYPITESNPPVCRVGSRNFIGPVATTSPQPVVHNQSFELLVDADSRSDYPRGWQLIASQISWEAYWATVHKNISPLPPIIPVDFGTDDVIALSAGQKPTSGYKVEVTAVETSVTGTTVRLSETSPQGCSSLQHITNPYYLVSTDKLTQPVSFVLSNKVHICAK